MKISIIFCFYNRLDLLTASLDSLRGSVADFDEVVVADDGSNEDIVTGVQELMGKYSFPIIHAWHPRQGPRRSATRNNGIRHATGDYLIFLDADIVVLHGAIRSHIDAAKPGYFAAGRRKFTTEEQCHQILSEGVSDSLLEFIYAELPEEPIEKEHRRFVRYTMLRRFRLVPSRKVSFGGEFSSFKKDIEAVNGYDENFVGWGGEDLDFALRMVQAGFKGTSVIKTARVLHLWHPSELGGKHWKEGPNMAYYLRSNKPVFCEKGLVHRF